MNFLLDPNFLNKICIVSHPTDGSATVAKLFDILQSTHTHLFSQFVKFL